MSGEVADDGYPVHRLGPPPAGPGSVARLGSRVLALLVDWIVCVLVVTLVGLDPLYGPPTDSLAALGVLLVEQTLLVGLLGTAIGHRACRIVVVRVDRAPIGLARGFARALLLCLAVPPLVMDRDARGLHDLAAGTVVVRR